MRKFSVESSFFSESDLVVLLFIVISHVGFWRRFASVKVVRFSNVVSLVIEQILRLMLHRGKNFHLSQPREEDYEENLRAFHLTLAQP